MNHEEIANRAALFVSRRDEPEWGAADEAELQAWLAESYAHKAVYWRLSRSWEIADRLAARGPQRTPSAARPWWRQKGPLGFASATALALIGLQILSFSSDDDDPAPRLAAATYATPVGGHEAIELADGSVAELNTATRVRAAATDDTRQVWLDEGEAFFKVAHDTAHPFVVHAGRYRVTVLGTSFSVKRSGQDVSVSVLEGRVRVDDTQASKPAHELPVLRAGQMAILRPTETLVSIGDGERVERALAWRDGMLSFDGAALADIAADFNRYNDRKIVVADCDMRAFSDRRIIGEGQPRIFRPAGLVWTAPTAR
ncbi:fec operon regulator FecR [Brevundimonas diminuta]|jgi:transmembrane sensor|uniref:Fec operon regulator FecR n=1 Tax=Brevundimonas diminuta TaxID=293 RepID=A0A246K797_BREDI|nr:MULTISPECIES: FecR domain-containing protein [Brevundimonas]EKY24371.1 sigma factor regulatory protein, FecR/PupR family [Brevundimonas diminuta 470-4]EGF94758.1 fecR family protein [Brevundimonas diminuta ATCC 11568]MDM8354397.1 FecR domain-containing protein [Brevundimonas diminuta]OMG60721.1 iron dicitrate transport regulator FecR [Brevundimonas sp. ZS04]OWR16746.1 iron dicitrate transport regulator FecR [Brevundimonas diminuta]